MLLQFTLQQTDVIDKPVSLSTLLNSDFERVNDYLADLIVGTLIAILTILFYLAALFSLTLWLTLLILAFIPLVIIVNVKLGNYVQSVYLKVQKNLDHLNGEIAQIQAGLVLIHAFKGAQRVLDRFEHYNERLKRDNIKYVAASSFLNNSLSLVASVVPFLILMLGSFFVLQGTMSVGSIMAVFSFSSTIFVPIAGLISMIPLYKELQGSIVRINSYVDTSNGNQYKEHILSEDIDATEARIELKDFNVGYAQAPRLTHLNRTIVGLTFIIGENGSGKSTLAKTIAGLIPSLSGTLTIKGAQHVAYIPNTSFFISGNSRRQSYHWVNRR